MRLLQFTDEHGSRRVGVIQDDDGSAFSLREFPSVFVLAQRALKRRISIAELVSQAAQGYAIDVAQLAATGRLRAPVDHPDPSRCLISGTGLTHRGSAVIRDEMAHAGGKPPPGKSDSMRMYALGLEGGRPAAGHVGAEPEWFYKGDGRCVVAPGKPLVRPHFAEDAGEEPELAGVYLVAEDGQPYRVGFVMANDFSDHRLEERNYLYVPSSKLRPCALSSQLLVGELPPLITGTSRIYRDGRVIWERPIRTGEAEMSHSIRNLEWHHFKHRQFRHPEDLHIHLFGTPVMSYSDRIVKQHGDIFEFDVPLFGPPLRNPLAHEAEGRLSECQVL